ncbi:ribosomal large subunit pseudouridine synthase E [Idiomarina fontislapidosi]|uniref:Pseudouridine synthase n=1 Tax=Idiomarina fontislapidosi TaxID=263723 RepID=A0A432Y9Y2_9GAMM|nr:pseudouridine synthase [Idiomarina fontislapidosi]PYE34364.1 ribosomal large subunit pseudouridine synthase E [Idiomarina fontislapidosi]RUO57676.1 pseudouridine synthase [Idiomarina fontislapidosi]
MPTQHRRKRSPRRPRPVNPKLVLLNKPYGVLSQFSGEPDDVTLKDYVPHTNVYPAGRLDKDSEGLMLLTNDGVYQARLANPKYKVAKTYWVQVEGIPDEAQLAALRNGCELNDGMTKPAQVFAIDAPAGLWPRNPPVRERKTVPDSWISLSISEGKNRQVRRMTAHVGLPTLRLVRAQIGPFKLAGLQPGEWREEPPVW